MRPLTIATTLAALSLALAFPVLAQATAPSAPGATKPAVTAPAPAASQAKPAPTTTGTAPQAALLDINSASKDELDRLPGVGPARAEAIVKGRPYRGKNELLDRKILPEATYDAIKDQIVARQRG